MAYVIFLRVLVGLTLIVRRKNLDHSVWFVRALGPICVVSLLQGAMLQNRSLYAFASVGSRELIETSFICCTSELRSQG